jgi:hypothetical protein
MNTQIRWNALSPLEWEGLFSQIPRSNLLQSYAYARAASPYYRQKPRWGVIEIQGKPAGLLQVFEAGILGNLIHAVMIDRGPLWLPGYGGMVHQKQVFDILNITFRPRFGRRRRFLPEIEDGAAARKLIEQTGLKPVVGQTGYTTFWLDLTKDEESLRAGLEQKWRNRLNKAEQEGAMLEWDETGAAIPWVKAIYATDKAARGYAGIPPDLFERYAPLLALEKNLLIGRAVYNGAPEAFVVLVSHGRSATYLMGWSSDIGREKGAHNLLLWQGALSLKTKGIKELDLGGINDDAAKGIKDFKQGLGGQKISYLGPYA